MHTNVRKEDEGWDDKQRSRGYTVGGSVRDPMRSISVRNVIEEIDWYNREERMVSL
jgi:hypothetical protein